MVITKEVVYQALENFDNLYETATNIEVELNRKETKYITFLFDYDDALLLSKTERNRITNNKLLLMKRNHYTRANAGYIMEGRWYPSF